jgi:hypothetical protein
MTALVASDLDQTLIYSRRAIAYHGGGAGTVVAVETYQDVDSSFMTATAAAALAGLATQALFVPATTRTPEQLARVSLPGGSPRYAIAANGGVLLADGEADADWHRAVTARLRDGVALAEVLAHAAAVCRPEWTRSLRTAREFFCYAVLDRERIPPDLVAHTSAWAAERGWRVSLQGRKLYWVPQSLTKSAAVAEIVRRTGADRVLAAGDSLLDTDLLAGADRGIAARHGELVASGWHAEHVQVTAGCGITAGEQIVDWFAAALG